MPGDHPTPRILDQLLAGTVGDADFRHALSHLLRQCDVCLHFLRRALATVDQATADHHATIAHAAAADTAAPDDAALAAVLDRLATARYDSTLDAALDSAAPTVAAVQSDRLQAAALWAILEGTPPARRHRLIAADPRFHSWALAARYLDAAADIRWQDTPRSLDACRLALAIAERLPAAAYPAGLNHDLRGHALGCLADRAPPPASCITVTIALSACMLTDSCDSRPRDQESSGLLRRKLQLR